MDAAVHPFLASPPMLAAYPKLLPPATKNHLRVFQGRLDILFPDPADRFLDVGDAD